MPSRVRIPGFGGTVGVTTAASSGVAATSYEISTVIPEEVPLQLDLSPAAGPNVFWSGGAEAEGLATEYAEQMGGQTLAMTQIGRDAAAAAEGLPWEEQVPIWEGASQAFAETSVGNAAAFVSVDASASSMFWRIEWPALLQRAEVTGIDILFF
jgi:hypothetical protein